MLVDDSVKCTTPCLIALAPGRHTLRVELAGYRLARKVIETPKTGPPPPVTVVLEEKRGSLEVDSTPSGMLVILDGRPTGKPTPAGFQLSEGKHKVAIEVDGKLREGEVTITDDGLTRLQL